MKIYDPYLYSGKFETSTRRGKVLVNGNTVYCPISNFINYANAKGFFAFSHNGQVQENKQTVTTSTYSRYVNANGGLNVRNAPGGDRIGGLVNNTRVTIDNTSGEWSHIISPVQGWVSSNYLSSTQVNAQVTAQVTKKKITGYRTGNYRVNASVLNVRAGAGTKYRIKRYYELTANARKQNKKLGNYYTNGLRRNTVVTITQIKNSFGKCPSGWISLAYCTKI